MTNDPITNKTICTGIVTFVLSMAVLGLIGLCWDGLDVYLTFCVLISLLVTAAAVCITWLWLRLRQTEKQAADLRDRLYALEKILKVV